MNHKHILLFLLLCINLPVAAQLGEERNNWSVGINGGVNFNKVSFYPSIKQNMPMGITGGITARYISEKYFAMICGIQAELNYSQRGWEEKIEDNTNTYSRTMNYLELPLLAHLAFGRDRGAQFFINAGPQLGFLISEKETKSADWDTTNRPNGVVEQYGLMAQKKFDYGIVGGGGLEIRTGIGNFLLEGRYYFGLADFFNSTKKDPFEKSAHTTISARLTYLFDIKK